jgi:serine/threonine protein kinase
VVHADLKPENIMLCTERDGREQLRLVDFGVSSVHDQPFATVGEVCGTPGYLAPEVMAGALPTPSSDLYAAGIILFELLTGCAPFVGTSLEELVRQQVVRALPRPSDYRRGEAAYFDCVVARALDADPLRRFATATQLAAAFQEALDLPVRRTVIRAAAASQSVPTRQRQARRTTTWRPTRALPVLLAQPA